LSDIFGDTVPVYHDSASLEQLVRYFLTHEDERASLAARQHTAILPHSWTQRAHQVLDYIAT
jgi:spore maturation protein CgeB